MLPALGKMGTYIYAFYRLSNKFYKVYMYTKQFTIVLIRNF